MFNFFVETFWMGLNNLRLHKLRSLLTTLGIIFGVAAVIIMVAIGEGAKKEAMNQMNRLGATNVLVRSVKPPESTDASNRQQRLLQYGLKWTDFHRLKTLPFVNRVVPLRDTETEVVFNDERAPDANAIGTTEEIFEVINLQIARGRKLTSSDCRADTPAAVAVIGHLAAQQMFPFEDPLGRMVMIRQRGGPHVFVEIVGVMEPTGLRAGADGAGITNRNIDQDVYFPLPLAQQIFSDRISRRVSGSFELKEIELSEIWLQIDSIDNVERVERIAQTSIVEPRRMANRIDAEIKAPLQILRSAEKVQAQFNFIMVGIAAFALVVGGIGIMNIMLASVTERTREIGIRRALGAKRRHITLQFLIECTVVSLAGGLIGIVIGASLATGLPHIVGSAYPTQVTAWSIVGSFVVSGMIGIGFGLYPAMTAARMNPIDALRHE